MTIFRIVLAGLLAVAIVAMLVLAAVRSDGTPPPVPSAPPEVTVIGPCMPTCGVRR